MQSITAPCDVIVLAGQSNAQGFGLGACGNPYTPDARILLLRGDKPPVYRQFGATPDDSYLDVSEGESAVVEEAKIDGVGCFAHYFAREYVRSGRLKEGRKLLIVFAPVGGTGFSDKPWGKGKIERTSGLWTEDGPLYNRMLDLTDAALRLHPDNKLVGLLWHQGEFDAYEYNGQNLESQYSAWLETLINGVKNRYGAKTLPVVCGEFVRDTWYESHKQNSDVVMRATAKLMQKLGGGFVSSTGLPSNREKVGVDDDIHFCHESLRILGERYFAAYEKILLDASSL